jgi:putative membrane protein
MSAAEEATDHEPDYRFTLANERTYLAWIRTSLALLVGGAAVTHLLPSLGPTPLRYLLGLGLVGLAFVLAASSYHRWMRVDRAIRRGGPLPRSRMPLVLTIAVNTAILLTFALIILD